MTDTKINNTTSYPNTTPAAGDHVIGTDVSNTSNHADGETVTFEMQALATLFASLAGGWQFVEQLSGTTAPIAASAFEDGFEYRAVGWDIRPHGGSSRFIYFDVQKESDDSWISGSDTANNQAGMITDNVLGTNHYVQFDVVVPDPRISRVNHLVEMRSGVTYSASIASLSDAFGTSAFTQDLAPGNRHLNFSSADKIKSIRFYSSSGAFASGGTIDIYKRPIMHS